MPSLQQLNGPRNDHATETAGTRAEVLHVLREILDEQRALRRLVDDFAKAHLNARFPYGVPTDRWARR